VAAICGPTSRATRSRAPTPCCAATRWCICRSRTSHAPSTTCAEAAPGWLITTTFTGWQRNNDCDDGDWRALNLCRPPFSWPAPHALLDERCDEAGGAYRDKSLGVWRLDAL